GPAPARRGHGSAAWGRGCRTWNESPGTRGTWMRSSLAPPSRRSWSPGLGRLLDRRGSRPAVDAIGVARDVPIAALPVIVGRQDRPDVHDLGGGNVRARVRRIGGQAGRAEVGVPLVVARGRRARRGRVLADEERLGGVRLRAGVVLDGPDRLVGRRGTVEAVANLEIAGRPAAAVTGAERPDREHGAD